MYANLDATLQQIRIHLFCFVSRVRAASVFLENGTHSVSSRSSNVRTKSRNSRQTPQLQGLISLWDQWSQDKYDDVLCETKPLFVGEKLNVVQPGAPTV